MWETWVRSLGWEDPLEKGFPHSSVSKESACNAGDPGSIPGLGRSPGEGNGNPLQYSFLENLMDRGPWRATAHGVARVRQDLVTKSSPPRASLGAQMVKNLPIMQASQVQTLGQEDPPEKKMATHSSILAWRIPWTEKPSRLQSMGSQRVGHNLATKQRQQYTRKD